MNEQEKRDLEAILDQLKRDFVKTKERNNKRYNEAKTIEERAKINAELEAAREHLKKSQEIIRKNLEAGYAAEKTAQEKLSKEGQRINNEKLNKKMHPDYEEQPKFGVDVLKELEEIQRKEALIREQNRTRNQGRKL